MPELPFIVVEGRQVEESNSRARRDAVFESVRLYQIQTLRVPNLGLTNLGIIEFRGCSNNLVGQPVPSLIVNIAIGLYLIET